MVTVQRAFRAKYAKVFVLPLQFDLDDLKGTDHCSSEEYRCTHVDACVART